MQQFVVLAVGAICFPYRMKHLCLALVAFGTAAAFVRAQEEHRGPPVEIPDFSNLDEYTYEPKSTVTLGFRHLSGAKTQFSGQGRLLSQAETPPATGANLQRTYHDGSVSPDGRAVGRFDSGGNPILDPSSGSQLFESVAPDGRTNAWNYTDNSQRTADGFMTFHSYSAEIIDTLVRQQSGNSTNGLEIAVARDMGKLWGTRMAWTLGGGLSVNDISSSTSDHVLARLTTLTDYYSLFGRTVPDAPYSASSSATVPILDETGNPVMNEDGTARTTSVDTTVLLGNEPAARTTGLSDSEDAVTNRWKLKGAYYTFRAGPTVWVPISTRLRFSVSVGAALVYAGSNYTVSQSFTPETGLEITDTNTSSASKLLPGFYADATLQFDVTDRTGLYAGAIFQSTGSYTQTLETDTSNYSTKIDLARQQGLRAGMSIRF